MGCFCFCNYYDASGQQQGQQVCIRRKEGNYGKSIYPNRKDGKIVSFKFKAFLGRDEDGRQIIKCTAWKPTKSMTESKLVTQADKEAVIWERKVTDEYMKAGKTADPINITLESFINEIWLPAQKTDNNHRESTIAFYFYILKVVIPHIGNEKLHKITDRHIAQYLQYITVEYKTNRGASLSPKTIRHHYRVLNLIFGYAQKKEYIFINPMDKIEAPKLVNNKVDALSVGEVQRFIIAMGGISLVNRLMYMFILTTGMRRGELFGLQWQDIDFENKVVHIRRNVTYTGLSGTKVGLPKTSTGIRDIPITDKLYSLIIEYKAVETENNELAKDMFLFHAAAEIKNIHKQYRYLRYSILKDEFVVYRGRYEGIKNFRESIEYFERGIDDPDVTVSYGDTFMNIPYRIYDTRENQQLFEEYMKQMNYADGTVLTPKEQEEMLDYINNVMKIRSKDGTMYQTPGNAIRACGYWLKQVGKNFDRDNYGNTQLKS